MPNYSPSTTFIQGMPPEEGGHPGFGYQRQEIDGVVFERDVPVKMRDGITIYIDIFRPKDQAGLGSIIAWGPFGKHPNIDFKMFPGIDVDQKSLSPQTPWEALDPMVWAKYGYALIHPDPRGTWYSQGKATWMTRQEGEDEYDLIEWIAQQPWSNGKVGLTGVSYLSMSIYQVAALKPPHLAAIAPWEGISDFYRDVNLRGGIPTVTNCRKWMTITGRSKNEVEDIAAGVIDHPLFDEYWQSKIADWSQIDQPAFFVSSWSNQPLHTRGTLEAYKKVSSKQKWLDLHGYKEWYYFYQPEQQARLRSFFDHFLLGKKTDVLGWPPVRLEVRESYNQGYVRPEQEYPIARRKPTALYLNASNGTLGAQKPPSESKKSYCVDEGNIEQAIFEYTFAERTEIVGESKLRLWIAAEGANDADIFVGLQKLDAHGKLVGLAFNCRYNNGPVALGWLRASHRELDPKRSTPELPYHLHQREQLLTEGKPVAVDIEVRASGTVFEAGQKLRLIVQGADIFENTFGVRDHDPLRNKGRHVIYAGGQYDSHLLVPVIPNETTR